MWQTSSDNHKWIVFLIAVASLLFTFALWSTRLTEPFVGRHDNNTAWITIAGENYGRYGYFGIGFAQVMDVDPTATSPTNYYHRHPPLPSILVSVTGKFFGETEASSRLVSIFVTLLGASALFAMARSAYGVRIGLIALVLFMTTPMIAFYGQMVNHEPLVLGFFLLSLFFYLQYLHFPTNRRLLAIGVSIFLMSLSGWAAIFFGFTLCLHIFFFADRLWRLLTNVMAAMLIAILGWMGLGMLAVPGFWDSLLAAFVTRTGIEEQILWENLFDFLWKLGWNMARTRFTEALPVLAVIGLFWLWRHWGTRKSVKRNIDILILLTFVPALLQIFVFQQQTFIHDFMTYYLAPGLAIFGALGIAFLVNIFGVDTSWRKWAGGGLLGLLLLGLILSDVRWIWDMYRTRDNFPVEIAEAIQERVPEGEVVYSDIPWIPASWYYSQRQILPLNQAGEGDEYHQMLCKRDAELPNRGDVVQAGRWVCTFEYIRS